MADSEIQKSLEAHAMGRWQCLAARLIASALEEDTADVLLVRDLLFPDLEPGVFQMLVNKGKRIS